MNYTVTVYVGSIEYRTFNLRASMNAANALKAAAPKALSLFRRKITELADTYSWTHAEYSIAGTNATIRAFG